jgi:putative pyruvate formate lyase activating enzyme
VYDWKIIRPDAIAVWRNKEVVRRLSWYYSVMRGLKPAKFLVVRQVEVPEVSRPSDLRELSEEELWRIHDKHVKLFRDMLEEVKSKETVDPRKYMSPPPKVSLLHVKRELAWRLASPCRLCERNCRVDRWKRIGACRLNIDTYVHAAFLHLGEEAPLVPSGTIFYGGCNFTCVYCQNYDISQTAPRTGMKVSEIELSFIQDKLAGRGARNINHVGGDPTPSLHTIVGSLLYVRSNIPQLWNSNLYLTVEAMKILVDLIDIWLPDFKYGNNKCAFRLSAVPRYWEVVTRNLKIAAKHGDMIIRHLVLPNHVDCCTIPILKWIARNLPVNRILVNIMDQYRPMHLVARTPRRWKDIAIPPTYAEIMRARRVATELGIMWEPVS